jgi:hypothetical protein
MAAVLGVRVPSQKGLHLCRNGGDQGDRNFAVSALPAGQCSFKCTSLDVRAVAMSTWKWLLERDLNFFFAGLLPLACGRCLIQFGGDDDTDRNASEKESCMQSIKAVVQRQLCVCVRDVERVLLGAQHRGMGLLGPIGALPDASLTRAAE